MSSALPTTHVRVGIGVLVRIATPDGYKVICGIRKGSHGAGTLALPGGHLEMYESWSACAIREVAEETGLILDGSTLRMAHATDDPMPEEGKHYVTIFMAGECCPERNARPIAPRTMEPHKCEGWEKYGWEDLKQKNEESLLFGPLKNLVEESPASVLKFLGVEP